MSYDEDLEAMMAMTIAMTKGNASEGLESVQNAEQARARSNCRLPIDMNPSRKVFETLGFSFTDIGDDVLFQATLPDGWTLKADRGGYCTYLIDEKGRTRGSYFYKGAFYDRSGNMSLDNRFCIDYERTDKNDRNSPIIVSVKDADGTIIFTAGQCDKLYSDQYDNLRAEAREYLKANYPEWENPVMYWD